MPCLVWFGNVLEQLARSLFLALWTLAFQPPIEHRRVGLTSANTKDHSMKIVMAVIKPFKLEKVRDALIFVGVPA